MRYASTERWLIVNADDFGQSHAINRGVVAAHERGIVTSASLMVRWPASREAAAHARAHPELSLGLHVDFGEWTYRDHQWAPIYVVASHTDRESASREVARQLETFRELLGADPTHLDSHQHVHREEPLRSILAETARQLGVPLRQHHPTIRYEGSFYGQSGRGYPVPEAINSGALIRLIQGLPAGVTEIGCHPGEMGDDLETMYRGERALEVRALCDPSMRAAIEKCGVRLCSYRDVAAGDR